MVFLAYGKYRVLLKSVRGVSNKLYASAALVSQPPV